jgi:hypothetical protein
MPADSIEVYVAGLADEVKEVKELCWIQAAGVVVCLALSAVFSRRYLAKGAVCG